MFEESELQMQPSKLSTGYMAGASSVFEIPELAQFYGSAPTICEEPHNFYLAFEVSNIFTMTFGDIIPEAISGQQFIFLGIILRPKDDNVATCAQLLCIAPTDFDNNFAAVQDTTGTPEADQFFTIPLERVLELKYQMKAADVMKTQLLNGDQFQKAVVKVISHLTQVKVNRVAEYAHLSLFSVRAAGPAEIVNSGELIDLVEVEDDQEVINVSDASGNDAADATSNPEKNRKRARELAGLKQPANVNFSIYNYDSLF